MKIFSTSRNISNLGKMSEQEFSLEKWKAVVRRRTKRLLIGRDPYAFLREEGLKVMRWDGDKEPLIVPLPEGVEVLKFKHLYELGDPSCYPGEMNCSPHIVAKPVFSSDPLVASLGRENFEPYVW